MEAQSGESFQKAPRGTLKRLRKKAGREDAKRLKAFRDGVWAREQLLAFMASGSGIARCQHCRVSVWREVEPFGEVDHIKPRSTCTLAERYDPANGQLLCSKCHRKKHA